MFPFLSTVICGQNHLSQWNESHQRTSLWPTVGDPNQYVPYTNVIFLDDNVIEGGIHRTGFRAFKSTWFKGFKMVLSEIRVPVVIAESAGIWLGVAFLFLSATWDTCQSSWGVMILLRPPACFCIVFLPLADFFFFF